MTRLRKLHKYRSRDKESFLMIFVSKLQAHFRKQKQPLKIYPQRTTDELENQYRNALLVPDVIDYGEEQWTDNYLTGS